MSVANFYARYRKPTRKTELFFRPIEGPVSCQRRKNWRARGRSVPKGMAALEVVLTTVITMIIFSFTTYWTMRLSRVVFSVIGEMVGSPLL